MKTHPNPIPSIRLGALALLTLATTSRGALVIAESFSGGYAVGSLTGQNATGYGLSGAWAQTGTGPNLEYRTTGLEMTGVHSSGGSVAQTTGGTANNNSRTATAAFGSSLPTGQLYGSYLFSTTTHNPDSRSLGLVAVGPSGSNDGTTTADQGTFAWAGNTFNSANSNNSSEGPGVRAGGSGWVNPGVSLTTGATYLMLFEFNATSGQTVAWVLDQAQLTHHLTADSLTNASLSAAGIGTDSDQVIWTGSASAANGIGALSHLHLIGLARNADFAYVWDEFRVSDSSLLESVTIPEPATALLGALGILGTLRRRRA